MKKTNDQIMEELSLKSLEILENLFDSNLIIFSLDPETKILSQSINPQNKKISFEGKELLLYDITFSKEFRRKNKNKYYYLNLFYNTGQLEFFRTYYEEFLKYKYDYEIILPEESEEIDEFVFYVRENDSKSIIYDFSYHLNDYKEYILKSDINNILNFFLTLGIYEFLCGNFKENIYYNY